MALFKYSGFIYGHTITSDNQWIDFSENGITELSNEVDLGSYSFTDFVSKVAAAFNEVGTQVYTFGVNRVTRKVSIAAPSNFDLYVTTGTHSEISVFNLLGFTSDKTGTNFYEADIASGSFFEPQFYLQNYIDFEDDVRNASSSVNQSASGKVEVISYGLIKQMSCNITLQTNITPQSVIKNNPTGVDDLRAFMNYAITKAPLEFVKDIDGVNFTKCILEKTPEDQNGTAFKLKELYARKLVGYFETGTINFREI